MRQATIGSMDQRILLQRLSRTPDGAGGTTEAWLNFGCNPHVWANVIAKAGSETMVEGRITATFTVLFTIRNRRDIDPRDRIIWQGVAYNIRGIRDMGARELNMVIEAERGVAQ